jgi:hypothetical protein
MLQSVTDATKVWYDPDPIGIPKRKRNLWRRLLQPTIKCYLAKIMVWVVTGQQQ